jgi:hypothetical protein
MKVTLEAKPVEEYESDAHPKNILMFFGIKRRKTQMKKDMNRHSGGRSKRNTYGTMP